MMNGIWKSLTALSLIGWSGCALAQTYNVTEIGSLGGTQGSFTNWGSVNDSGQVTGYSYLSGSQTSTAFIYANGTIQSLGASGTSQGYGINDSGQVAGASGTCGFVTVEGVIEELNNLLAKCGAQAADSSTGVAINSAGNVAGYSSFTGGYVHAVYFAAGRIKDLGTLGGNSSYAYGVNSSGQVTGYSETAAGANHAFITHAGGLTDLGTLGGDSSVGYAINASGLVTGSSQIAGNAATHPFLFNKGVMHNLGGLGGTAGVGLAINSSGEVVGYATVPSGHSRAFLFTGGKLVNLNTLIDPSDPLALYVTLISATGISKTGFIAANGIDSRYPGVNQVFLLTPVEN
jgi:probable HAF family extracellular repeat protein